jgi:4-diphosphocytidyl-2-C-methyl-D-erythritol kinase
MVIRKTWLCHAKVNMTLDVLEKRPEDGYHYIDTIMLPISLWDQIHAEDSHRIEVMTFPEIPGSMEANLVFRAVALLKKVTGYKGGVRLHVDKSIPIAGGLAGGSTNAGAVLTGLNELWQTGLSDSDLVALAIQLGSDVPFFIQSRPARVQGIGEVVTPINVAKPIWIVLVVPDIIKSTGKVFGWFDELTEIRRPDTVGMERALAAGDPVLMAAALANVLESAVIPRHPEIDRVKRAMVDNGALGALMSGAGPTVFGLTESHEEAIRLAGRLRKDWAKVIVASAG